MGDRRVIGAATNMARFAGLEQAMTYHLTQNHFPPVPKSMVPVCITAIDKAVAGSWDELIALPDNVSHNGDSEASVSKIVESFHLHAFIEAKRSQS